MAVMGVLTAHIHLFSLGEHPEPLWCPRKHNHSLRAAAVLCPKDPSIVSDNWDRASRGLREP